VTPAAQPGGAGPRRAPRLGPQDHIAPYLTRRGRFATIDPLEPRRLPIWPKWLGVLGWAGLLGGALYKAWSATREPDGG
jgi:hypothetical protein